jgi:oligopeptide transport system permease protein
MSAVFVPAEADFQPFARRGALTVSPQRSATYWQDAWRRFLQNRRALASLCIALAILLFTLLGPALWRVDPASQDLAEISVGPTFGQRELLVDEPCTPVAPAAQQAFESVGTPTTEGVTLTWQSVPGATAYALFRHEYPPQGARDLGLPLARLESTQHAYVDRLRLERRRYYYTLVIEEGDRAIAYHRIGLSPVKAIIRSEAIRLGLVRSDQQVGTFFRLPAHPFGTDALGRDILARTVQGGRTSLFIGIVAPLLFLMIGVAYGGLAGFLGGRLDREMMRLADFVMALPFVLFMILFKIMLGLAPGESGVLPMLIALVVLSWPASARLVRAQVLQSRSLAFVDAARLMGASPAYLITRHLLPNLLSVLLVSLTFSIPAAIFTEAFLSFIGMGVVPPTPSWGSLCNEGLRSVLSHPHELIFPALFISATVLAFNMLGDGLRDCLDVKLRVTR